MDQSLFPTNELRQRPANSGRVLLIDPPGLEEIINLQPRRSDKPLQSLARFSSRSRRGYDNDPGSHRRDGVARERMTAPSAWRVGR